MKVGDRVIVNPFDYSFKNPIGEDLVCTQPKYKGIIKKIEDFDNGLIGKKCTIEITEGMQPHTTKSFEGSELTFHIAELELDVQYYRNERLNKLLDKDED
jgi:hypothetical protein